MPRWKVEYELYPEILDEQTVTEVCPISLMFFVPWTYRASETSRIPMI